MKDEEMRTLARQRVRMRQGLRIHFTCYVAVNIFLVVVWFITDFAGYFWPLWPISAWTVGIAIHGMCVYVYANSNSGEYETEREYRKLKTQESQKENNEV